MSQPRTTTPPLHLTRDQIEAVFVTRSAKYPDCVVVDADDFAQLKALAIHAATSASENDARTAAIEECVKVIDRKGQALTNEYCHGDAGPDGYTWTNKEAEWQVILLGELADEFRALKGTQDSPMPTK